MGSFLVEFKPTSSAAEALEQQTSAAFTEGQAEEGFPHKVMTDPGGDRKIVGNLHFDLLTL